MWVPSTTATSPLARLTDEPELEPPPPQAAEKAVKTARRNMQRARPINKLRRYFAADFEYSIEGFEYL